MLHFEDINGLHPCLPLPSFSAVAQDSSSAQQLQANVLPSLTRAIQDALHNVEEERAPIDGNNKSSKDDDDADQIRHIIRLQNLHDITAGLSIWTAPQTQCTSSRPLQGPGSYPVLVLGRHTMLPASWRLRHGDISRFHAIIHWTNIDREQLLVVPPYSAVPPHNGPYQTVKGTCNNVPPKSLNIEGELDHDVVQQRRSPSPSPRTKSGTERSEGAAETTQLDERGGRPKSQRGKLMTEKAAPSHQDPQVGDGPQPHQPRRMVRFQDRRDLSPVVVNPIRNNEASGGSEVEGDGGWPRQTKPHRMEKGTVREATDLHYAREKEPLLPLPSTKKTRKTRDQTTDPEDNLAVQSGTIERPMSMDSKSNSRSEGAVGCPSSATSEGVKGHWKKGKRKTSLSGEHEGAAVPLSSSTRDCSPLVFAQPSSHSSNASNLEKGVPADPTLLHQVPPVDKGRQSLKVVSPSPVPIALPRQFGVSSPHRTLVLTVIGRNAVFLNSTHIPIGQPAVLEVGSIISFLEDALNPWSGILRREDRTQMVQPESSSQDAKSGHLEALLRAQGLYLNPKTAPGVLLGLFSQYQPSHSVSATIAGLITEHPHAVEEGKNLANANIATTSVSHAKNKKKLHTTCHTMVTAGNVQGQEEPKMEVEEDDEYYHVVSPLRLSRADTQQLLLIHSLPLQQTGSEAQKELLGPFPLPPALKDQEPQMVKGSQRPVKGKGSRGKGAAVLRRELFPEEVKDDGKDIIPHDTVAKDVRPAPPPPPPPPTVDARLTSAELLLLKQRELWLHAKENPLPLPVFLVTRRAQSPPTTITNTLSRLNIIDNHRYAPPSTFTRRPITTTTAAAVRRQVKPQAVEGDSTSIENAASTGPSLTGHSSGKVRSQALSMPQPGEGSVRDQTNVERKKPYHLNDCRRGKNSVREAQTRSPPITTKARELTPSTSKASAHQLESATETSGKKAPKNTTTLSKGKGTLSEKNSAKGQQETVSKSSKKTVGNSTPLVKGMLSLAERRRRGLLHRPEVDEDET